ncbi:MAG: hypothetical protein KF823_12780 [Xanthomonadales bacterium]|nr:hypothetical protein [Xanthomonadales bacterium]
MDRQPPRPPPEPSPQMRRLAASIARSTEVARTLPGRLSRSLAPTREGRKRRLANLALLGLALVPFVIAWATLHGRGGQGEWQVVQELAPPWTLATADPAPAPLGLLGARVRFDRHRVQAPSPLGCRRASYQWLQQPRAAAVLVALPDSPAAQAESRAAALGLPAQVTTLRVDCGEARFDYHRVGDELLAVVGGRLLRLGP